jgi:hypothetical protein
LRSNTGEARHAFVASDDARMITGQTFIYDGGVCIRCEIVIEVLIAWRDRIGHRLIGA